MLNKLIQLTKPSFELLNSRNQFSENELNKSANFTYSRTQEKKNQLISNNSQSQTLLTNYSKLCNTNNKRFFNNKSQDKLTNDPKLLCYDNKYVPVINKQQLTKLETILSECFSSSGNILFINGPKGCCKKTSLKYCASNLGIQYLTLDLSILVDDASMQKNTKNYTSNYGTKDDEVSTYINRNTNGRNNIAIDNLKYMLNRFIDNNQKNEKCLIHIIEYKTILMDKKLITKFYEQLNQYSCNSVALVLIFTNETAKIDLIYYLGQTIINSNKLKLLEFKKLTKNIIYKFLINKQKNSPNNNISEEIIQYISNSSEGDLCKALISYDIETKLNLDNYKQNNLNNINSKQNIVVKSNSKPIVSIFHLIGKLIYSKKIPLHKICFTNIQDANFIHNILSNWKMFYLNNLELLQIIYDFALSLSHYVLLNGNLYCIGKFTNCINRNCVYEYYDWISNNIGIRQNINNRHNNRSTKYTSKQIIARNKLNNSIAPLYLFENTYKNKCELYDIEANDASIQLRWHMGPALIDYNYIKNITNLTFYDIINYFLFNIEVLYTSIADFAYIYTELACIEHYYNKNFNDQCFRQELTKLLLKAVNYSRKTKINRATKELIPLTNKNATLNNAKLTSENILNQKIDNMNNIKCYAKKNYLLQIDIWFDTSLLH